MPYSPKKPCRFQGCPCFVTSGKHYCDNHKQYEASSNRMTARSKGYSRRWNSESKRFLATHPWCKICEEQGKLTPATVVDHIIPHRGDQTIFWNYSNWQPLCKRCHDKKTLTEDIHVEYTYDIKV